jgi:hypothetical protein
VKLNGIVNHPFRTFCSKACPDGDWKSTLWDMGSGRC